MLGFRLCKFDNSCFRHKLNENQQNTYLKRVLTINKERIMIRNVCKLN